MTAHPSHPNLLGELSRAVHRDHGARRSRSRIALAVFALVAVSAVSVAAATQAPWWQTARPPVNPQVVDRQLAPSLDSDFPPTADRSRARTVAEWNGATLVAAPVGDSGGYCLLPALPGSPDIGFSCEYQASDEVRSFARPGSERRWIIWGRFVAPQAAVLDLGPAIGTALEVKLQPGGFFIADLPPSRWAALDNRAGTATLLDRSGTRLQSLCLNFGPAPTSAQAGKYDTPSPLSSSGECRAHVSIPMAPELDQARRLVETTLQYGVGIMDAGTRVAIYEAPDAGVKATCIFVAPVPLPTDQHPAGAMACGQSANQTSPKHPLTVSMSSARTNGSYHHLVTGEIDPGIEAARVEVQLDGRTFPLALANAHFIGELPPSAKPDVRSGSVVAYNSAGQEVAQRSLDFRPR